MYDPIARFYDLTHRDLRDDVSFVRELVRQRGPRVLELGAGSGRLLVELATVAQHVYGVDSSEAMLALARERIGLLPNSLRERVTVTQADMALLDLPGTVETFDLAIVPYNTWMHLDSEQAIGTLRGMKQYLRENGTLFIDLANPLHIADTPDDPTLLLEKTLTDPDSGEMILQFAANRLDPDAQMLHVTWVFDACPLGGGPVTRTVSQMAYHYRYPHQMQLLLEETGYRLVDMLGDYDRTPFSEESPRLLLLAEKL